MRTALADAAARQQMEGFRPLHDEQEGRFRTASLHPPAAPNDHHHQDLANVLPACGVATKAPPCALVAFGNVLLPQPLRPAGRAWCMAVPVVIEGGYGVARCMLLPCFEHCRERNIGRLHH